MHIYFIIIIGGNIYIADSNNHRIRKIDSLGIINTFAGSGATGATSGGFSGDGNAATSAVLNSPGGVAFDASNNYVYIADTNNNRVRKVDSSGIISTFAGTGATSNIIVNNIAATSASLSAPYGVAIDPSGNVYIADSGHNRIRVVKSGIITTVAGSAQPGFSGDDGPATSCKLNKPTMVQVDVFGNMYVSDTNNQRIRMINYTSNNITTVAGSGSASQGSYSGDGGAATSATLYSPHGVALDSSGIQSYSKLSFTFNLIIHRRSHLYCGYE